MKSYFVAHAIPTESEFADLIDGSLNQKEDGIVKPPGGPLSVEAAGDVQSQKKALNLYASFADDAPAWTLSLRPQSGLVDLPSGSRGLSIHDGRGTSRLFIDHATGNVGVGTIKPAERLHVAGDARVDGPLLAGSVQPASGVLRVVGDVDLTGNVLWSGAVEPLLRRWQQMPGAARDIGAGGYDNVWIIGAACADAGGSSPARWSHVDWAEVVGQAERVACDPDGNPWFIDFQGKIYAFDGSEKWPLLAGEASDIGVGCNESAWIVGTDAAPGGFSVYRWANGSWELIAGQGAVRIAVSTNGTPWIVAADSKIYRRDGDTWTLLPGAARDIGVGTGENAWIIGATPAEGGYSIHRWTGSDWGPALGGGAAISVGADDIPWMIDDKNRIFKRTA